MFANSRFGALLVPALTVLALALALPGCEEDLKPKITKLGASPPCDVIKPITRVNIDPVDSSIVSIDTLDIAMEVRFFGRASSGNELADPTGANSPLEWEWNFGDGGTAKNDVGPIHRYRTPGEYTVRLTVRDDDGDEDSETIQVIVGQAYTDLDIMKIGISPIPELTFRVVPGSTAVDNSDWWGDQLAVDRLYMGFEGTLETSCSVSGLFEQYLWAWELRDRTSSQTIPRVDVNPARLRYSPAYVDMGGELSVTETVTGINRIANSETLNPVGLKVGNSIPEAVAPGSADPHQLHGYLLGGVKELSFELEWPDSAASLAGVDFDPAVEAAFTVSSSQPAPGRAAISLTSGAGYAGTEVTTPIAVLRFETRGATPGTYPIRVREPFLMRDGDPETGGPVSWADGFIELDSDCDEDGIADRFQVETDPDNYDCNENGKHDTCDILDGTSQDCNGNGIPDKCDEDANQNGIPDDCE